MTKGKPGGHEEWFFLDNKLLNQEYSNQLVSLGLADTLIASFKKMKNLIGTMQGRLLPKYKGRYQAHPIDYWQKEFEIAKNIGLGCIEFIFDFNEFKKPFVNRGRFE